MLPGREEMRVQIPPPEQTKRLEDMAKYLIGLDPGTNTGLAIWDAIERRFVRLETLGIVTAMAELVQFLRYHGAMTDCAFYIEDARQRQWLPRERNLSEYRGKLMGAGSVKRDCAIWEEFAIYYGIPLNLVPPRKGLTKWDADTFNKMTGWKGRTSNHARDAALLVWGK